MSQGLDRVRQAARQRKKEQFTALIHHLDVDLLRESFFWLQRKAAPGVDGVTWQQYREGLEERLVQLHGRIHRNAYRATPSRRRGGVGTSRSPARAVAAQGGAGLLRLPRRARQLPAHEGVPKPCHRSLAKGASAPWSADRTTWRRAFRLAAEWLPRAVSFTLGPMCASTPPTRAGARCANRARRDLCGGRPVTGGPIAI